MSVGISSQCQGVKNTLDIILLNTGQEVFVRRHWRCWSLHIRAVAVFCGDEVQSLVSRRVRRRFQEAIQFGFPDHVANTIPNEKQDLDDVLCGKRCVQRQATHLGDVCAQGAMYAAAFDT